MDGDGLDDYLIPRRKVGFFVPSFNGAFCLIYFASVMEMQSFPRRQ